MQTAIEKRTFLILLTVVTLLFAVILRPFWSAIFWAVVITVLFAPMQTRLLVHMKGHHTRTALLTLLICSVIVIMPVLALLSAFIGEGVGLYARIESEEINPALFIDRVVGAIPFLPGLMERIGIDTASIRAYLSSSAVGISEVIAQQALSVGRNTVNFTISLALMLYLTFFLLRDGEKIVRKMEAAVPLSPTRKKLLFSKFVEVTRATVKGNLLVAVVQGALGGFIFWLLGIPAAVLWAVVMAFLSLIPAVGAALVWVPVAIYLYATGKWVEASVLVAYGALIIGLADNVLRPILVGRDTKLPDYIVLFSTMGGLALMGINGFVIGPLIAAVFLSFWAIFTADLAANTGD
ncbi:MAG: AI-2E family transporter [Gammaproteobacteria bacterium]|nr:AI-2E family transporter [Gammaproteobacteria bacterium]MDP2347457.1 AI-2E family transporter [Gammaproteobacteria bacterium]